MPQVTRKGPSWRDGPPDRLPHAVRERERLHTAPQRQQQQEEPVRIPAGNAPAAEWRSFVRVQTPAYPGDVEEAGRNELRDWYHAVHGGGDQPTPEPEPEPESVAGDG